MLPYKTMSDVDVFTCWHVCLHSNLMFPMTLEEEIICINCAVDFLALESQIRNLDVMIETVEDCVLA